MLFVHGELSQPAEIIHTVNSLNEPQEAALCSGFRAAQRFDEVQKKHHENTAVFALMLKKNDRNMVL